MDKLGKRKIKIIHLKETLSRLSGRRGPDGVKMVDRVRGHETTSACPPVDTDPSWSTPCCV